MEKTILNFHFDYLTPSLSANKVQTTKHSSTWSPVAIWAIFELLQNDIVFTTFFRLKMLIWKSENGLVLHHSAFFEPATEKSYYTNTLDHSISYSSWSKGSFTSEVILNDNKWRIWRWWWCWWRLLWRYLVMKKKNRNDDEDENECACN